MKKKTKQLDKSLKSVDDFMKDKKKLKVTYIEKDTGNVITKWMYNSELKKLKEEDK